MQSESLGETVSTLSQRVEEWLALLPADRHLTEVDCPIGHDYRIKWSEYSFRESVSGPVKQAVMALGVARFDTFADQIRRDIDALRSLAKEFVNDCNESPPPSGFQYWQDAAINDLLRLRPEVAADLAFAFADFNETVADVLRRTKNGEVTSKERENLSPADTPELPTKIEIGPASATVELDGVLYTVDPLGAKAVKLLVDAYPHAVGIGVELSTKPHRVIQKLPEKIRLHCISMGNKGYRWVL